MSKQGPEGKLKADVLDALKHVGGVHAMRRNAGKMNILGRWIDLGEQGHPDVEVMLPNRRVVFLELKSPTGEETENQKRWRESAEKLGHRVYLIRDVDSAVAVVTTERDEA